MQRLLTLVFLLCLAVPAGISISGCSRNPAGQYCNGEGFGLKLTAVASIDLEPRTTGVSVSFAQTQQLSAPTAKTCKGNAASVSSYTYGTTNNQIVDVSPSGVVCAGTWNRRSGGGIPDFTICNPPSPLPSTGAGNLPYASAYVYATADGVTSNQLQVFVHPLVTSLSLVLEQQGNPTATIAGCLSQTQTAQLDTQAYYNLSGSQTLLCEPNSTQYPSCSVALGNLAYSPQNGTIASIDQFGIITAELPGTTYITASVAGGASSAGYFSTCPPASINVTLNGQTSGTVTQGVIQNLTTTVLDTNGNTIQGLSLLYQSTNPLDIGANNAGAVSANYAGKATLYAVCEPGGCNPSPIDKVGINQTGVSITSNPVTITTPGVASDYLWMSSPSTQPCAGAPASTNPYSSVGSLYFTPVELINGGIASPVKMPFVPNSMVMDATGTNLFFGTCHELMIYLTSSNSLTKEDPNVPGVVLAAAPNDATILINDQARKLFYIYNVAGGSYSTFSGIGTAAQWTPDSQTLYIVGADYSTNPAGTPTLFVNNTNTGWTTYPLSTPVCSPLTVAACASNVAITVPGVGAFLSGSPTTMHAWCPEVTPNSTGTTLTEAYPQVPTDDSLPETQILSATSDGAHILGTNLNSASSATLYDMDLDLAVSLNNGACPTAKSSTESTNITTSPVTATQHTSISFPVQVSAINQIVTSPDSDLSFLTYYPAAGSAGTATLQYYQPLPDGGLGTPDSIAFSSATKPTAPVAGAFSLDGTLFFAATSGDNLVHYINLLTTPFTDSQQIDPGLVDINGNHIPATVITVKPRPTT